MKNVTNINELMKGDLVVITKGELKGLTGKVVDDAYPIHWVMLSGTKKEVANVHVNQLKKLELLTTGQMIDVLEYGQVAERVYEEAGVCSDAYTKARIDEDGDLMFFVEHWDRFYWSYERLTGSVINSKWIIN